MWNPLKALFWPSELSQKSVSLFHGPSIASWLPGHTLMCPCQPVHANRCCMCKIHTQMLVPSPTVHTHSSLIQEAPSREVTLLGLGLLSPGPELYSTELSEKTLEKDIEALQLLLRRHSVKAKKSEHWLTFCQKNIILLLNPAVDQPQGSMACNLVTGHPHIRVSSNRKFPEDKWGVDLGCQWQKNQ